MTHHIASQLTQRSAVVVHNKGRDRVRRTVSFLLISTVSFVVGGYFSLCYAPPILLPWVLGIKVPTDEESLTLFEPPDQMSREIDEHIRSCALARQLDNDPDFTCSRPHLKIPEEVRRHNLTGGTLAGPGMIVVPPYIWSERGGKSMVAIFYLGNDVSGYPGLVHGGMLATMMDEGLARCAFPAMPNGVGVTANLQINYRHTTRTAQFLVLRARTIKVEGRKAWAEGWIESLEPAGVGEAQKLIEATALFVEPRHAKVSLFLPAVDVGREADPDATGIEKAQSGGYMILLESAMTPQCVLPPLREGNRLVLCLKKKIMIGKQLLECLDRALLGQSDLPIEKEVWSYCGPQFSILSTLDSGAQHCLGQRTSLCLSRSYASIESHVLSLWKAEFPSAVCTQGPRLQLVAMKSFEAHGICWHRTHVGRC